MQEGMAPKGKYRPTIFVGKEYLSQLVHPEDPRRPYNKNPHRTAEGGTAHLQMGQSRSAQKANIGKKHLER